MKTAIAFLPATEEEAGLRIEIAKQAPWTELDRPRKVRVRASNTSKDILSGEIRLDQPDKWRIEGSPVQRFHLPPGGTDVLVFRVAMGAGTYDALYPLHASATFRRNGRDRSVKTVLVVSAHPPRQLRSENHHSVYAKKFELRRQENSQVLGERDLLAIGYVDPNQVIITPRKNEFSVLPRGKARDQQSKAFYLPGKSATKYQECDCILFRPPHAKNLHGQIAAEYVIELPNVQPIVFKSGFAVDGLRGGKQDSREGVTFKVQIAGTENRLEFDTLFEQRLATGEQGMLRLDLSPYRGQLIKLRLVGTGGWGRKSDVGNASWHQPLLLAGLQSAPESAPAKERRVAKAIHSAREALTNRAKGTNRSGIAFRINSDAGPMALAVVPGPRGLLDAQIAIVGQESVVFDGFESEVSGIPAAELLHPDNPIRIHGERNTLVVDHLLQHRGKPLILRAQVHPVKEGLAVGWSMPDVERDRRGHPRFTRLALGASSVATRRVYFGYGYVVEGSPRFSLLYRGSALSTRFIGVDYENDLSLVMATDPFPDRLEHDQARHRTTLVAHHDAKFTLVPSITGAFSAARRWREIANLKASPGVAMIRGKLCIDQWRGDYSQAARDLNLATKYGLNEAVFVRHHWQRWGYDYRLPDIYPPAGDRQAFNTMAKAAKLNGRLFALHDNYSDFYPDAQGFSYKHISFNDQYEPLPAWYNKRRKAQSYKWHPLKVLPFLEKNLAMIDGDIDPTAYFIDVWAAAPLIDLYDSDGDFYPAFIDAKARQQGFDVAWRLIGGPVISEQGLDAMIGHLAAGQSDHIPIMSKPRRHALHVEHQDWERVPWYDIGHHGKFVLFAGGLGHRYSAHRAVEHHGYGSDDYLSMTILGGRTPMSDGPFFRRTVMTYWLLQPISAELEQQELLAHRFVGNNLHRQEVIWSHGRVVVNRDDENWAIGGALLPRYGFIADVGEHHADISRRDGMVTAMATSPGVLFVDARPPDKYFSPNNNIGAPRAGESNRLNLARKVIDFGPAATNTAFRLMSKGDVWRLTLSPGSRAAWIKLRLDQLGATGKRVQMIEQVDLHDRQVAKVEFKVENNSLVFNTKDNAFQYRVHFSH